MKNKTFYFLFFISLFIRASLYGGDYLPCGSSTGNRLIQNTVGYVIPIVGSCGFTVPDMRPRWDRQPGRGWRVFGALKQTPAPGTLITREGPACASGNFTVTISANFVFDNGTPVNPRDDRYCSVDVVDSYFWTDASPPTARNISFATSNTNFSPSALKANFTSSSLSDNCTPLSVLRDNLEFIADPRRPSIAEIRCGSTNTYRVSFRTRDACGLASNWAIATIQFLDVLPPVRPSLYAPLNFYTNTSCRTFISPSMITANSIDDHTPASQIRYSYRIISPINLRGDIPAAGRFLDASGSCPVNGLFTLRVCAQDCFGNGNLHVGDNILDVNCEYVTLNIGDKIAPVLTSACGSTVDLFANCTAIMPNLTAGLIISENCSAVSIYQQPAPGSVLNDGSLKAFGLALGSPRTFNCDATKLNDNYVDCMNYMGTFKSIPVSFIFVDCDGNCTVQSNCKTVNLSTTISPLQVSKDGFNFNENAKEKISYSKGDESIALSNFPNPFLDFTDIRIESPQSGQGKLVFYTPDGKILLERQLSFHVGQTSERIQKNELSYTGLLFYSLNYEDKTAGPNKQVWSKLIIH